MKGLLSLHRKASGCFLSGWLLLLLRRHWQLPRRLLRKGELFSLSWLTCSSHNTRSLYYGKEYTSRPQRLS